MFSTISAIRDFGWKTCQNVALSKFYPRSEMVARFHTIEEVCEILAIEKPQAYALVRSGELRAIKIGGRGQWRVENSELEAFIQRAYEQTAAQIQAEKTSSKTAS